MMLPVLPDRGTGRGEQLKHGDHHSRNCGSADLCGESEISAVYLDGAGRSGHLWRSSLRWRVTGWSGSQSGEIRRNMKKAIRRCRDLYAIGSGGLFGRGLGNSVQKLGFVPEAQNDMIFSIICEELGLVGAGNPDPCCF